MKVPEDIAQPYERFAAIYDRIGSDTFGLGLLDRTLELVRQHGIPLKAALDLACGTGTVVLELARRGVSTTGLDLSPAMLAQARRKAAAEPHLPVTFIQGDMRQFTLPEPVQLATCFFDAMNYLLRDEDLQATFNCVHAALEPGGLFVFDMNSVYALSHIWGNNVFCEEFEDCMYVWRNEYEPFTRTGTLTATFFVRRGELYEKFTELHVERGYRIDEVRRYLEEAGFAVLAVLRPNGRAATEAAPRHLYVARREG